MKLEYASSESKESRDNDELQPPKKYLHPTELECIILAVTEVNE